MRPRKYGFLRFFVGSQVVWYSFDCHLPGLPPPGPTLHPSVSLFEFKGAARIHLVHRAIQLLTQHREAAVGRQFNLI